MILLLTNEVPCPPKSRPAVILVCGSSWWVPVLDVLHLRLTACHFFCRACLGVGVYQKWPNGETTIFMGIWICEVMGRAPSPPQKKQNLQFAWEFAFAK